MTRGPSPHAIEALRAPGTTRDAQIVALKQLKNDIVGHERRKELAVQQGALEPLVGILRGAGGESEERGGGGAPRDLLAVWTPADEARLQALLVLGSLASGGPAFVAPFRAAGVPRVCVETLAAPAAPPRLVTAALQALQSLATSWAAGIDVPELDIFGRESSAAFLDILRQPSASAAGRQQLRLMADILAVAAASDAARAALVQAGVLDTLAALLASYAISQRHVDSDQSMYLPLPPPPLAVPNIMAAISNIITGSTYRAHRFILAPAIRDLFSGPRNGNGHGHGDLRHELGPRYGFVDPSGEPLLPPLHVPPYGTTSHSVSRSFPALAALQAHHRPRAAGFDLTPSTGDADHANAVCGWLMLLARAMHGHDRLVALKLLALVNGALDDDPVVAVHRSEYVQKTRERERQLALLAVPLVVQFVQQAAAESQASPEGAPTREEADARRIKEHACEIFALLVGRSKELQVAAVEKGAVKHGPVPLRDDTAIKYVCPILKRTFDVVPLAQPLWSGGKSSGASDAGLTPDTCRLGSRGLPPEIQHTMKCRQGALAAIAALADTQDDYRKVIADAGVVPCIIDSLKPFPPDFAAQFAPRRGQVHAGEGNTVDVILAACRAAKAMSRSVALLRTSLIDAGIAKPILALLVHPDPHVQLAATDVCTNMVLDFAPMRDTFVEEGVVRTLTEHAKTSSTKLRLSSLWALKHLVLKSKPEEKISILEELGVGWLVGAIQGEQDKSGGLVSSGGGGGGGVSIGVSGSNAAGEQVDLLNPASTSMDVDEDDDDHAPEEDDEDREDDYDNDDQDGEDGEVMYDESSSTHYQASQLRSTLHPPPSSSSFSSKKYLSSIRELEQNPTLQAKRDDIAIQEQALDFVRNLLNGEDCGLMCDHLMEQVGSAKIFDLLTAKLSPLPYSARAGGRPVYNPVEILHSTVTILNHIANGLPRHKQLLIAQKPLLQVWLPHFNHPDFKIRAMNLWAVQGLTWIEDESDRKEARQRALELRDMGIEGKVRKLQDDPVLEVRERVKTALKQFDQLI